MSSDYKQPQPGSATSAADDDGKEKMIARARTEFIARIHERISPKSLAADAHGFVTYLFERTVRYAINLGVDWDNDRPKRKYALRRLGEVAEFAAFTSGDEVTCAALKGSADFFIPVWREVCPVRPFVFCEGYVEGTKTGAFDCAQQGPIPETIGSNSTLDDVLVRAHGHFMAQVYESIEPKTLSTEALAFMECLFERTVKYAIEVRKVDWDNDGPRRRYALRRLAEIAEFAAVRTKGTEVTCESCKAAADRIIEMWKQYCEEKGIEPRFVFCEGYTDTPCPCTGASGNSA